jgi:hypothetical protein
MKATNTFLGGISFVVVAAGLFLIPSLFGLGRQHPLIIAGACFVGAILGSLGIAMLAASFIEDRIDALERKLDFFEQKRRRDAEMAEDDR